MLLLNLEGDSDLFSSENWKLFWKTVRKMVEEDFKVWGRLATSSPAN